MSWHRFFLKRNSMECTNGKQMNSMYMDICSNRREVSEKKKKEKNGLIAFVSNDFPAHVKAEMLNWKYFGWSKRHH